jgi:hypothetical protein
MFGNYVWITAFILATTKRKLEALTALKARNIVERGYSYNSLIADNELQAKFA